MSGGSKLPDEVSFTHLDEELFDGAGATKRDLVDYFDAVEARIIPCLTDRPLSVIRVRPGQPPFMQKNLPKYTPDWVPRVPIWAEASRREVSYALCNDRRTLLWFANQRAVEYHVTLFKIAHPEHPDYLVLDLDPPEGAPFAVVVQAAQLVRQALTEAGMAGAVKTSGAKGMHVFVPLTTGSSPEDVAAATRAVAARAERIDPDLGTTAFVKDERAGQGVSRLDTCWWRHGRCRVQPTDPARRTGLVPACLGGYRPGGSGRLHSPQRRRPAGWSRSMDGPDAASAAA